MATPEQARYVRFICSRYYRMKRDLQKMPITDPSRRFRKIKVLAAAKAYKKFKPDLDLTPYMEEA